MLDFARDEAVRRGYDEMRLATHSLLDENISLYEYLGWVVFERGESFVRMKKSVV